MLKKLLIPFVFVIVVSAIYFVSQARQAKEDSKSEVRTFLKEGQQYIPFSLKDLKGKTINTKDLEGKVLFVNFWATWCVPCKTEMPSMQALDEKLNKKYPNQFKMLAVNIDTVNVPQVVELFALDLKLKFPILLDTKDIKDKYKTTGVPETFIIDKKGKIAKMYVGAIDWNLSKNIDTIEKIITKDK